MAGGGVGEAMLIGAAVGATAGGAGAAIQGGDPLQGALVGGATGAIGGGIGGALAPAATVAPGTVAGTTAGTTAGAAAPVTVSAAVPAGASGTGITSSFTPATTSSIFGGAAQGTNAATTLGSSIASGGSGAAGGGFGSIAAPTGSTVGAGMGSGASGFGSIAAPTATTGGASSLGIAQGSALPAGGYSATGVTPVNANPGNFTGYAPQLSNTQLGVTAAGGFLGGAMGAERAQSGAPDEEYDGPLNRLRYDPDQFTASAPTYAPGSVYRPTYAAEGGIMQAFQSGGPVERMSQMNTALNPQGGLYPQGMVDKTQYAVPTQRPTSMEVLDAGAQRTFASGGIARYAPGGMIDPSMGMAAQQSSQQSSGSQGIDSLMGNKKRMMTPEQMNAVAMQGMSKEAMQDVYGQMAAQGLAKGGPAGNKDMAAIDAYIAAAQGGDMASVMAKAQAGDYNAMIALNKVRKTPNQNYVKGGQLGGYSDGGRMLKGPGDGMSDNIPATIAGKQPARLADGEFVVPADVVSHLGNGSTDAGAKQLYAMMNRVRKARTGNPKQGKQIKPAKYMVA
jgi:hypothetical protein